MNDHYITDPTHVRLFSDGREWFLDGANDEGGYTEVCYRFDTFNEARDAMPHFVMSCQDCGITFHWQSPRLNRGIGRKVTSGFLGLEGEL